MIFIELLILALAVWKISHILVYEDGPFDIFLKARTATGITYDDDGDIQNMPDRTLPKFVSCFSCMSVWIAGLVYLVWYFEPIPVYIFSISGGATLINYIRE